MATPTTLPASSNPSPTSANGSATGSNTMGAASSSLYVGELAPDVTEVCFP